jgi:hypothetical protein
MKEFLRWTNFHLWTNEGFCHVRWWLCFCLCSASDWGPSFSLFHGVRARKPHPCAGWRTCGEVRMTCHTRSDISHTKQKWDRKVRKTRWTTRDRDKEGEDRSDFLRKALSSWPLSLCKTLPLVSSFPRTTSDEDKTLTHAPFYCCLCCMPSAHGSCPESSFDT